MNEKRWNEAELFLLDRWSDARELELSMGEIRKKHRAFFEQVGQMIRDTHSELDSVHIFVDQLYEGAGYILFSRKEWPDGTDPYYAPGIIMDGLRLEDLVSGDTKNHSTRLYVASRLRKRLGNSFEDLRRMIVDEAKTKNVAELQKGVEIAQQKSDGLVQIPSKPRLELFKLLTADDPQPAVEYFRAQAAGMIPFVKVMDRFFAREGPAKS